MRFLLPVVTVSAVLLLSSYAKADGPVGQQPSEYQKQPIQGEYVAPMYQQTQPAYVPQSVAMSGPREIKDWHDGDPIPPGYRPVERVRKGLIIGGAVTFGSLYLLSALVAAANADANKGGSNPAVALYVPALGPFIQMPSSDSSTARVFLAIDGIGQCAGVAMLVVGLTSSNTVLVRNDLGQAAPPKPELHFMPLVGAGTTGAGVFGTF